LDYFGFATVIAGGKRQLELARPLRILERLLPRNSSGGFTP
jgi:hypothetical protein